MTCSCDEFRDPATGLLYARCGACVDAILLEKNALAAATWHDHTLVLALAERLYVCFEILNRLAEKTK